MPAPLVIPAVIGAGMAAGGVASAVKGARIGAKPNQSYLGGSPEALAERRRAANAGIQSGQDQINAGTGLLGQGVESARGIASQGAGLTDQAQGFFGAAQGSIAQGGQARDQAFQMQRAAALGQAPSVAEGLLRQNADDAARAQLGMAAGARGGGALAAQRNASNVGAQLQLQAGQQAATLRAQEIAQARNALAGIANDYTGAGGMQAGIGSGLLGQGMQAQQFGANAEAGAGQFVAGLGADREQTYVGVQNDVDRTQLEAELDYDRRRQAENQRRSDRFFQLGGALIGGGGNILASSFGGR